jgi:hypothetical protein
MTTQDVISLVPWSNAKVDTLNAYQKNPAYTSYTCGKTGCVLDSVATEKGWRCPTCGGYSDGVSFVHTKFSNHDFSYSLREGD